MSADGITRNVAGDGEFTCDVVFSPDDGGYYLHGFWINDGKTTDAVSREVWATKAEAIAAAKTGHIAWEH